MQIARYALAFAAAAAFQIAAKAQRRQIFAGSSWLESISETIMDDRWRERTRQLIAPAAELTCTH